MTRTITVGSRDSQLALWQTEHVIALLQKRFPDVNCRIVEMKTKGDKILDQSLSKIGDKGLFTQELEDAMMNGDIDFAVHSLKDMPTTLPEGLQLTAFITREDHRDAFLSHQGDSIEALPYEATVGTSSLRRKAQLLSLRPDLKVVDLRGNVNTRLRKFAEGPYDAVILAAAGLDRLSLSDHITTRLPEEDFMPAVGQGVIVVESSTSNKDINALLAAINDADTEAAVTAERAFMCALQGGCQVPIGAYARVIDTHLQLEGMVATLDGACVLRAEVQGEASEAEALGVMLAEQMRALGAEAILAEIRQ